MAIIDNKVYTIRLPQKRTIKLKIATKTYQIQLPQTRKFTIQIKDFTLANTALLTMNLKKIVLSLNLTLKSFKTINVSIGENHIVAIIEKLIKPIQTITLGKNIISAIPSGSSHLNLTVNQHFPISIDFSQYVYKTLTVNCGKQHILFTEIVGREKLLSDYLSSTINSLKNITLDRMKIS